MKKTIFTLCLTFAISFTNISQADLEVQGRTEAIKKRVKEKAKEEQPGKEIIFKSSIPIEKTYKVKTHNKDALLCQVEISSEYAQSGENLDVDATIENSHCEASKGNYIVRVRTRNEAGESHTSRYQESWSREDSQPVKASHVYSMNGDTDLVNVQIQMPLDDYCVCLTEKDVAQE